MRVFCIVEDDGEVHEKYTIRRQAQEAIVDFLDDADHDRVLALAEELAAKTGYKIKEREIPDQEYFELMVDSGDTDEPFNLNDE